MLKSKTFDAAGGPAGGARSLPGLLRAAIWKDVEAAREEQRELWCTGWPRSWLCILAFSNLARFAELILLIFFKIFQIEYQVRV